MHPTRVLLALSLLCLMAPPARAADRWRWPVRGPVVGAFDYRSAAPFERGQHRGIDIAAPAGTRVVSACPGRVRFAGSAGDGGDTVSVRCGPLIATYLHLGSISVRAGERVGAGDGLGRVGTSGRPGPAVPHLHLGARRAANRWGYVDPLALLGGGSGIPGAGPLPGRPRMPAPLAVRVPRGLGRAPAPVPARVPAPAAIPARSLPAAAPRKSAGLPWPVWAGAGLLALAIPLPALRWRQRRRAEPDRAVSERAVARG